MDKEAIAAEIAQTAGDEKSRETADALTALVSNWCLSGVRLLLICLLHIVSCRRVVSVDTVRRSFLWERKDLQFLKAMVQSRKLGEGRVFLSWERKLPDPCFWPMMEIDGEINGRKKNTAASVELPETGREESLDYRGDGKVKNGNAKWSWMCCKSKFGGESCLLGWPIWRPLFWPIFWPIRDHHAVDWADFSGFMTSGFSVKKGQKS